MTDRRSRSDAVPSTPLGGVLTALTGAVVLVGAYVTAGCTARGCRTDAGLTFSRISVADWGVFWRDGCNTCGTDLTPVLAGVALLAVGVLWLGGRAVSAGATSTFDFGG